jgi:hypothetical protein
MGSHKRGKLRYKIVPLVHFHILSSLLSSTSQTKVGERENRDTKAVLNKNLEKEKKEEWARQDLFFCRVKENTENEKDDRGEMKIYIFVVSFIPSASISIEASHISLSTTRKRGGARQTCSFWSLFVSLLSLPMKISLITPLPMKILVNCTDDAKQDRAKDHGRRREEPILKLKDGLSTEFSTSQLPSPSFLLQIAGAFPPSPKLIWTLINTKIK